MCLYATVQYSVYYMCFKCLYFQIFVITIFNIIILYISMDKYYNKYLKYKQKYIIYKNIMLGGSLHDTYIETLSTLCESINNYIKLDNNIRLENKNIPITIISDISYNNMFVCHTYNISNSYIITDTHISVNKNIDEDCNYNNLIT